jgi:hypothetical protein
MWVFVLYSRYASVRAIESKSPVDDQQWLTYWVLYSLITLFELTFAKILEWYTNPFYDFHLFRVLAEFDDTFKSLNFTLCWLYHVVDVI